MTESKPANTGAVLLAALLGIVIGAVGGFYIGFWRHRDPRPELLPGGARPGTPQARLERVQPMPGIAGGGPAVMGAGMRPGLTLARTIRYLAVLQSAQGEGLTAEQAKKLLPLLKSLQKRDPLPPAEAEKRLSAIMQSLTDGQKRLLQNLSPLGAPSGIAGATPLTPRTRPTVPMAAGLAQAGGGGAMAGGASEVDPARPFASERNRAALEELIGALVKMSR